MSEQITDKVLSLPPYRVVPESALRIMRTQLVVLLLLPAAAGWMFFGYQALKLMMVAVIGAALAEGLCSRARHLKVPGSLEHSLIMGLLVAFMLPANIPGYVVFIGSVAAVLIGKQFFGGMGHYLWHPALVGRVVVELFFHDKVSASSGPLLARENMFFGNINGVVEKSCNWFTIDWFSAAAPAEGTGFLLEKPVEALRDFGDLLLGDTGVEMGQYLLAKLPSLEHCIVGAVPGGMGETCSLALILACLYLVYRGYVHWQLPVMFVISALAGAMVLPILIERDGEPVNVVMLPIIAENIAVGCTYVNYQLFSGGLLLGACILAGDMTSRPITVSGQVFYAAGAGLMTMIFRLYTPIAIPVCAAILVMNTLVPTIDRLTRPRGPKPRGIKK
jgi:electron transport complex protein RnfD